MKNFFPLMNADPLTSGSGSAVATPPAVAAVVASGGGAAPATGTVPTAATAPAAWHTEFWRPDGTINHTVLDRLPDSLKPLGPTLSNLKTGEDLLGKLHHLNSLAGRKGLAPLPADAKPEDIAAQQAVLRAVLGVPEKPEGYSLSRPEGLPEAMWDEAQAKEVAGLLHKHNAPPALAKDLIAYEAKRVQGIAEAQAQYEQEWYASQDNEFREGLKKSGDDYDKSMALINQVAARFGVAADSPIMKNASVRSLLKQVGAAVAEPALKGVDGGQAPSIKSARSLAESVMHDKSNPDYPAFWDAAHAKNKEVKSRVNALMEQAVREEQAAQQGARR